MAPELRALTHDALLIWGDTDARERALLAVVLAWERGDSEALRAAIARVDDAVVEGLRALRLPRGAVAGVRVEAVGRGWVGQKTPTCDLVLDGTLVSAAIRVQRRPDEVFRTWIHESLHGRLPFAASGSGHYRTRGYEEGMVEGLTRVVTRERAAMKILDSSYDYYVRAYRALAAVLDIDVEQLWRALWAYPVGQVRSAFGPVVDRVCRQASRGALTPAERLRLQGLADRMFDASRNAIAESDQRMLMRTWGAVLG